MRHPSAIPCFLALLLLALSSSTASGSPQAPTTKFTIHLDDVRSDEAQADLLNLFIREDENQTRIVLTLVNRSVQRGRAKPTFYYLENLRVRPGRLLRIEPEGRARDYEGRIERIDARFPPGKPPQLVIFAFGTPPPPLQQTRPFPRLATEGFQGQRALAKTTAEHGKLDPDVITCSGDTPGDLRIRYGTLVDVVGVGKAFSTVYVIHDARHTYDLANGLQTRYFGDRRVLAGSAK